MDSAGPTARTGSVSPAASESSATPWLLARGARAATTTASAGWLAGSGRGYYYLHFLEGLACPFSWWLAIFLGFDPLLKDLLENLDFQVLIVVFCIGLLLYTCH